MESVDVRILVCAAMIVLLLAAAIWMVKAMVPARKEPLAPWVVGHLRAYVERTGNPPDPEDGHRVSTSTLHLIGM